MESGREMSDAALEKQFFDPLAEDGEFEIAVGTLINVQLERLSEGTRHTCRLIGYLRGRSLLVTMPTESDGVEVPYYFVNDEVTLRYFSGREVHGFTTWVRKVCKDPFSYLHLAFPTRVERVRVREEPRTRCSLPVKVMCPEGEPGEGRIVDLSPTGAQLECDALSVEVGTHLKLAFSVTFAGHDVAFELDAEVRNRKNGGADDDGAPGYRIGVMFPDLGEQDRLRLTGYVYEAIVSHRLA